MADEEDGKKPTRPPLFSTLETYGEKRPSAYDDDFDPHEEVGPQHLATIGPIIAVYLWIDNDRGCVDWVAFALLVGGLLATLLMGGWRRIDVMRVWAAGGVGLVVVGWMLHIWPMRLAGLIVAPIAGFIALAGWGVGRR